MFLLILEDGKDMSMEHQYLHSNMFLLILGADEMGYDMPYHLHSNMFLLILNGDRHGASPLRIYIPICFY